MRKHYFVVEITRIEITSNEGYLISSDEVLKVVRVFKTKAKAEEFINGRRGYYILTLEG